MTDRTTVPAGRRAVCAAAGALVIGLLLGSCGGGDEPPAAASGGGSTPAASAAVPEGNAKPLPKSPPKTLSIAKLGVTAPVSPLGLRPDGRIEEPPLSRPNLTGWYKLGPTPGENGPSVILGHVDANKKQAVFYRLKDLKQGDRIEVTRQDGTTATFAVTSKQDVDKNAFPHKKVFAETLDYSSLRLVTCGGAFDASTGHYKNNLIVYAKLVQSA
ncbi:class F sortase [Actinomadura soli]|uniref:Class F sortase n=1 Tax=Actinomadura soli TaxID=2508997 RepID=A0A5C4JBF1_9ACTN|nr:class F sortase [Actinomadura soli]TMR00416.1 class F sortase [Actinomadura soli]